MYTKSAITMRILMTIFGFHLQVAGSAYSCGFYRSSIKLYTCLIVFRGFHKHIWIRKSRYKFRNFVFFVAILSGTVF